MKILAFQAWDGGSHRAVRDSIQRHSEHDWTWVALPAVGPRWRLRLGAAELVDKARGEGALEGEFDALFTTSMSDATQLRGLLPSKMSNLPLVLYMHENQAAYPASEHVREEDRARDAHLVTTNLTSMLAADLVVWNSLFNRDSFLERALVLLSKAPDRSVRRWASEIRGRSEIAWPPVEQIPDAVLRNPAKSSYPDSPLVAWPHRWEHDKGPDELLELADSLASKLDLRFALLGERGSRVPPAMELFRERYHDRIEHDGWIEDREAYLRMLARSDWVLSTARHEFFGIAVVEALLCGCLPWLPERLSYPELVPKHAQGLSPGNPPEHPGELSKDIREHLAPAQASVAVDRIDTLIAASARVGRTHQGVQPNVHQERSSSQS